MNIVSLDLIDIPAYRMRQKFDEKKMAELVESIASIGLLHPPVVEQVGDRYTLRAGERRYRAINQLYMGFGSFTHAGILFDFVHAQIPVTILSELTEIERMQIELEENAIRDDLHWSEVAKARSDLHALRVAQAQAEDRVHTMADTAAEIGASGPNVGVYDSIKIARYLDDPDVAKAKSLKEAKSILERKQRNILNEELVSRLGPAKSKHTLVNADALTYMRTIPDSTVDIILTDPPYGIDMHTMNTQSGSESGNTHTYLDTPEYADRCVQGLVAEATHFCKPSAHIFMFCDIRHFFRFKGMYEVAGWYVWPDPIIWNKGGTGTLKGGANGPRHCYEVILFAQRGSKRFNVLSDVVAAGNADTALHPAAKSPEGLSNILRYSAVPGDIIYDGFCGSGGIFEAAEQHMCTVIACERDPAHFATASLALERLCK